MRSCLAQTPLTRIVPPGQIDLFVVTHVDRDHLGGALALLRHKELGIKRIWFNGYVHLTPQRGDRLGHADRLGPVDGEELTAEIMSRKLRWNTAFRGRSVVAPETGALYERALRDLRLTVLSPTWKTLEALVTPWETLVRKAGLVPGQPSEGEDGPGDRLGGDDTLDFEELAATPQTHDGSEANGSSIALLAEYGDKRLLLAGDAHPDVLVASLARLDPARRTLDLFKLPHHGSGSNVSTALLKAVACGRYLFSTNGEGLKRPHPHREAVARVIVHGGTNQELIFNYDVETTRLWRKPPDFGNNMSYRYRTKYGPATGGVSIDLS